MDIFGKNVEDLNIFSVSKVKSDSFSKKIIEYSKLPGFEAVVTKVDDDRIWVRIKDREWVLDTEYNMVKNSDRAADLPVDFDWRAKQEEADKYIETDCDTWDYAFINPEEARILIDNFEHGFSLNYMYGEEDN